ncbi:MAG: phosphate ABC transporter permease subunit PstC [Gemmatimonadales bacterium]
MGTTGASASHRRTAGGARSLVGTARADQVFRIALIVAAVSIPVLLVFLLVELIRGAELAIAQFGFSFITRNVWDPIKGDFGAISLIVGTLVTSLVALLIAAPLSLGVAIYLTEFAPPWLSRPVSMIIELLAAIPSVVYGLWGLFVLVPVLRHTVFPALRSALGFLPFFKGVIYGPSVLSASIILAIMVMPFIMSVSREVLLAVPNSQREAAMGLGATRWEAVRTAIVPYARSGIIGAVILGLGRALGETMAVTMLIGNSHELSLSLFAPGYTMAAVIANEFKEAVTPLHISAMVYVALVLFLLTVLMNAAARLLIWRVSRGAGPVGGRGI